MEVSVILPWSVIELMPDIPGIAPARPLVGPINSLRNSELFFNPVRPDVANPQVRALCFHSAEFDKDPGAC